MSIDLEISSINFPPDFVWGVSTSALQTEGAHDLHGKGPSIWDEFADKQKVKNAENHYSASNFYHQFEEDIDIVKTLRIPNFRFSISWSRILPNGTGEINKQGIDFYHRVLDHCLANGIEPWVTLYHWDLPLALEKKGGWANRDIIIYFKEYVELCVKTFKGKVKHWMVLNEPLVFTGAGYFAGLHAPGRRGINNFLPAAHHAALCQSIGFRIIKNLQPDAMVGTTFSCSLISPYSYREKDVLAAKRIDALLNRMFIEPSLGMGYPIDSLPVLGKMKNWFKPGDEQLLRADFDFIGIQVYTREVVANSYFTPYVRAKVIGASSRKVHHTKMDWEVYPPAIYEMIKQFSAYEGVKKIFVTENGASFHDELILGRVDDLNRIHYLKKHIDKLHEASVDFHKIKGYFVWSLTDNFEWSEGYDQRFGLVYIDYKTQERIIKNSGYWYRKFLLDN